MDSTERLPFTARGHLDRRHDADFYPFDMQFIGAVATRIINEVKGVNRVVYDVTSKPPGTIEWEQGEAAAGRLRTPFTTGGLKRQPAFRRAKDLPRPECASADRSSRRCSGIHRTASLIPANR